MTRSLVTLFSAGVSGLALTVAACAESDTEENSETSDAAVEAGAEAGALQDAAEQAAPAGPDPLQTAVETAPDSAWRRVEAEDLLKITTTEGVVWVELADEFAPAHTARMRELARDDWFDFKVWHRVIDNFMAQGGGALDDPSIAPPTEPLQAEFAIRRDPDEIAVTEIQERPVNPRSDRSRIQAGFWNGFPAATQPAAAAAIMGDGRVNTFLVHCPGAAAMARTNDPNSANAQFYIVRGQAEHLNAQYTVWGKVRAGLDAVYALEEGTLGQTYNFNPSFIEDVEVASDLPPAERVTIEVMDTRSDAFADYLTALEAAGGEQPDLCEIDVPVRVGE
ncbi:MAG: peptidylprolyl isomerase [Oceanicaulis sp.]